MEEIKVANFKTRLEAFQDRIKTVSPTPVVLFNLFKELVDILIKNQRDQKPPPKKEE